MKLNYNFLHLASIQLVKVHQRFILLRDSEIKCFCILNGSNQPCCVQFFVLLWSCVFRRESCYGTRLGQSAVFEASCGEVPLQKTQSASWLGWGREGGQGGGLKVTMMFHKVEISFSSYIPK